MELLWYVIMMMTLTIIATSLVCSNQYCYRHITSPHILVKHNSLMTRPWDVYHMQYKYPNISIYTKSYDKHPP